MIFPMPLLNSSSDTSPLLFQAQGVFTESNRTNKRSAKGVSLNLLKPRLSRTAKTWLKLSLVRTPLVLQFLKASRMYAVSLSLLRAVLAAGDLLLGLLFCWGWVSGQATLLRTADFCWPWPIMLPILIMVPIRHARPSIQLFMSATSKYKSAPTFSFKGRTQSLTRSNDPAFLPSPDIYNPEKPTKKQSPHIKFPQSKRSEWDQIKYSVNGPGPGSHQPRSHITDGPKLTIINKRFKDTVIKTPSPGQYESNPSLLLKNSPSFTMQKKTISSKDLTIQKNISKPSPGQYEQPILKYHSTLVSIGKSKRPAIQSKNRTPGPGSYDSDEAFKKSVLSGSKCRLNKDKRKIDFSLGERSPGPGNYETKSNFEYNRQKQRGYSCRAKQVFKNPLNQFPGPGQYQSPILNRTRSVPSIKIPKTTRPAFTDMQAKYFRSNPGPGSHQLEPLDKTKFRSMSVHRFSKSKMMHEVTPTSSCENISPFTYQVNDSFKNKESPSFSISKNSKRGLFTDRRDSTPEPGHYEPKQTLLRESAVSHRIPNSTRPNMIKHVMDNPGPSHYAFEINKRLGRNFKFSKSPRKNINDEKISKEVSSINESYQLREQFPNPPRYMGVSPKVRYPSHKKIKVNEERMSKILAQHSTHDF